jgi:3-deoxy-D-manno-octulosonic acid (KDO) 8-phosphate synthase
MRGKCEIPGDGVCEKNRKKKIGFQYKTKNDSASRSSLRGCRAW